MAENDREATERVVLRLVSMEGDEAEQYEVVGIGFGAKIPTIDKLAKEQPGKYRSVPMRSWKNGKEIVLPEKPKPESRLFE